MEEAIIQRIEEIIAKNKMSRTAFAKLIGVEQTTLNNQIIGKRSLSLSTVLSLLGAFPEVSADWLLRGRDAPEHPPAIRFWPGVEATGGGIEFPDAPDESACVAMVLPGFPGCTDAVRIYGESMSPRFRNGDVILLREWKEGFVEYGRAYLIVTRGGARMVKYLRRGSTPGTLLCVSENPDYDPFEIEAADVVRLFLVMGAVSKLGL